MRCVPNVAPPWELRAAEPGVLGPLGALKGPVGVGVIARVEAAMMGRVMRRISCVYLQNRVSMAWLWTSKPHKPHAEYSASDGA